MRDERDGMVQDLDGSAEIVLKILLVGAPKSGKTSLVRRLCDKAFRETYLATLGFDVTVVPYATYQGRPVKLHLWDVAGSQLNAHPCHHALIGDGAEGVMYVMDVTNRDSLQAVDDWDRALSNFLPPWACKLLVGHKADLPAYVVNDEALSLYVASASGFCGWCLTVGSSEYGDYDVAARRGGGGSTADVGGRYKGQSLSGEKQLSVSEAVRTLVGHVFRAGGAGGNGARPAGVVGTGASPGGAAPYPSRDLDDALETVGLLGLGSGPLPIRRASDDLVATTAQREYLEGDRRGEGGGGGEGGASDMPQLLRRGRGPDPSWTAGAGILADGHTASSDPGWDYFAGRMEREEAEKLLRGRPDGTFFLRRKGPSLLVLTYVAKVPGTQGGGRKSSGTLSPRRTLASPQDDSSRRGVFKGGGGMGVGDRGGSDVEEGAGDDDPAESGSVQHALLVHEGGFFSDEKGRLGCFPTLDELLKSKIKALARHPLTFRREGNRYVLVDPEAKTPDNSLKSAPIDRRHSPTSDWSSGLPPHSTSPSPSTPFARPDDATNLARGTIAASRAPVVSSNIFDGRHDDVAAAGAAATVPAAMETAAVAAVAADAERLSPPPHSPLSAPPTGSSPSVDTGALYESSLRGRRSRIGSRSSSKSASHNWADKRADKTKHPMGEGVEGRGRGGDAASSGGSLWMQAAAAVENKSTASGSSGRRLGKSGNTSDKSRGLDSLSGGGGGGRTVASTGYGTGKVSPGSGGSSLQSGSAWGRRRPGKGSASSTDDGDSVSSSSLAEGADADLRGAQQQQHRWGVEASVMAAAAEEVAALNAAKDHPEAKRTEDRMLAAQAKVNNALTALERRLVSLVTRQAPMPSPRPSARPPDVRARRGFSSTYSSPRGSRSPCAPSLGEELQPQRWVAVAPTGATVVTAPLAAAAALLMERAWSFRKDLLASVDKLRERSVALAVAEASGAAAAAGGGGGGGGGITAAASAAVASAAVAGAAIGSAPVVGGDWLPAQGNQSPPLLAAARRFPLSDGQVFAADMGEVRRGLRVEGLRGEVTESMVGEVADSLTLHPAADTGREEPGAAAAAAAALGGVLGVSCCLDFDRILGDDSVLAGSAEGLPGNGQSEKVVGSPLSPEADSIDRLGPVSGGGVVTDGLLLGFGRTVIQSGDGGCVSGMSARERRHCSDPPRVGSLAPDAWPLVLRDVSAVEERCREYVSAWESAGGALGEACEDLGGDDVRGLTGFFAAQ